MRTLCLSALLPALALAVGCDNKSGFTQYNTPPNASITSPPDGSEYNEGELINFSGIVKDDQDGPEALAVQWSSDIDGVLVDGEAAAADASGIASWSTANLSEGTHVITLGVIDSDGESNQATTVVTIFGTEAAPELSIVHPIGGEYGIEGEDFEFQVTVSDAVDAAPDLAVLFSSDLDGDFCEPIPDALGVAICAASLSVGDHTLSFSVEDLDGFTAEEQVYFPVLSGDGVDDDGDGFTELQGDCDDGDPDINPIGEEVLNAEDDDCDGKIDEGSSSYDDDGDGFSELDGDCDDGNANVNPEATETCDTFDQDCDGTVDEETACYDDDGDGFSETASDCDDTEATVYPGGIEVSDGLDNDCDLTVDEGTETYDDDGDGFTELGGDCDDGDPAISPDAEEACNGYDDNCNGSADEAGADGCTPYYPDGDSDTYGDSSSAGSCLCGATPAYDVTNDGDCYDGNAQANPAQTAYFSTPRGDSSYDYNCDAVETERYADEYSCTYEVSGLSLDCVESPGWASGVAPCGASRTWASGCEFSLNLLDLLDLIAGGDLDGVDFCTYTATSTRMQECH